MPERVTAFGIPLRPFLYTLDQLATCLEVPFLRFKNNYVYYEGRSIGPKPHDKFLARNIAPVDSPPDWRVTEKEVIRWMKWAHIKVYSQGVVD